MEDKELFLYTEKAADMEGQRQITAAVSSELIEQGDKNNPSYP
jgi:hypothetical protein